MRIALLVPALLAAATAAAAPTGLHQTQRVGAYRVTPLVVLEDSRCPMNARCVWAGRALVRVAIAGRGRRVVRDLTLGEPAAPGIVLDSVSPDRMAGGPRRPLHYRFHFSPVRPD